MPRPTITRPFSPSEDKYIQTHWLVPLDLQAKVLRRKVEEVVYRRRSLLGFAARDLLDKKTERPRAEALNRGTQLSRVMASRRKGLKD